MEAWVVRDFVAVLGSDNVLTEPTELRTYECDGLTGYHVVPALVVLPGSAAEVAATVEVCARHGIPFVPRGAGTGLSGGALPVADGVVICVQRLRRVLEVARWTGGPSSSPASPTVRSAGRRHRTAGTTRRIRPVNCRWTPATRCPAWPVCRRSAQPRGPAGRASQSSTSPESVPSARTSVQGMTKEPLALLFEGHPAQQQLGTLG